MKSFLIATFLVLAMTQTLTIGPADNTPAVSAPVAAPAEPVAAPTPAPVCDMSAKLDCIRKRSNLTEDCNAVSHCSTATDDAAEEIVKGERCWTDGRMRCVLNQFEPAAATDCYGAVACMCNKDCVNQCALTTDTPFEVCNSRKCMCDLSLEAAKKLQDDYFSQPLKLANADSQGSFQKDLVDARVNG